MTDKVPPISDLYNFMDRVDKVHSCDNPDCVAYRDMDHIPLNPIYKVTLSDEASEQIERALDVVQYDIQDAIAFRISPIVVYTRLPDDIAISLAQQPGVECVRARADWSI